MPGHGVEKIAVVKSLSGYLVIKQLSGAASTGKLGLQIMIATVANLKPLPVDWTALSSVRLYCTSLYIVLLGRLQSFDWTSGLDWWTGLVD